MYQDSTNNAFTKALTYGHGIGGTRSGVLETTFAEETETDLFNEQAVLCGSTNDLVLKNFETLVEAGYQPGPSFSQMLAAAQRVCCAFDAESPARHACGATIAAAAGPGHARSGSATQRPDRRARTAARTSGLISLPSRDGQSYPPAAELARWEAAEVVLRLHVRLATPDFSLTSLTHSGPRWYSPRPGGMC